MSDIRDTIKFSPGEGVYIYEHALPELRWVERWVEHAAPGAKMRVGTVLQQRWRIVTEGKEPRHEWRDVPTVKEG